MLFCNECGERVVSATWTEAWEETVGRLEAVDVDARAHLEPCGHFATTTATPETPTYRSDDAPR